MANLKTPLAFIGGMLVGAAGTWVASAKYFNNKIDTEIAHIREEFDVARQELLNETEMLNVELEDSKREIQKLIAKSYEPSEEDVEEEPKVVEKKKATKKSKAIEELESKPEPEDIIAGKVDYTSFSKEASKKKEDPDIVIEPKTKKQKSSGYLIEKGDFASDDEHEKALLTYFSNDNVFLDAAGDICGGNIMGQIGKANINYLVREAASPIIYVRNDDNMVDYEIHLNEEPLYDESEDEAEEED